MKKQRIVRSASGHGFEVSADHRTIWIQGEDGSSARLGPMGYEIERYNGRSLVRPGGIYSAFRHKVRAMFGIDLPRMREALPRWLDEGSLTGRDAPEAQAACIEVTD